MRAASAAGPPALPVVGHLPTFLYDKLGFLSRSAARYGPIVKLHIGEPTFLLNDPEDVRHVLVVNADGYVKTPRLISDKGRKLSGSGLLTSVGNSHLRQRRMMQPVFYRKTVESFATNIAQGARECLARWSDGLEIEIRGEMTRLLQRNIVKSVLGSDADDEVAELTRAIAVRRRYMEHVFFSPLPEWMPTRIGRAYREAMRLIDAVVYRSIGARRAGSPGGDDMLSLLMRARYDDGSGMTDEQVRDEAVTLFITGFETTAEALAWSSYLLATHPAVEARMLEEVDRALGARSPSAGDLPNLPYVGQVFAESMRLYPPTWVFIRIARQDDVLPSGVAIPEGAKLYLSPYVLHRNPRYFPDPERFDPDRFTEKARKERPPLAYFPFGGGSRLCIGEHYAKMEGVLVLAAIAARCRLEPVPGQSIVLEPKMTLRPKNGIRMVVRERSRTGVEG